MSSSMPSISAKAVAARRLSFPLSVAPFGAPAS